MELNKEFVEEFEITEDVYRGFLATFHDQNPIHISDAYANKMGFQRKVMHGNILNGFVSFFIGECLPKKNIVITSQEIKFKKPCYLKDKLILKAKIVLAHEGLGLFDFKFTFLKQNPIQNVAVGKAQILVLGRPRDE